MWKLDLDVECVAIFRAGSQVKFYIRLKRFLSANILFYPTPPFIFDKFILSVILKERKKRNVHQKYRSTYFSNLQLVLDRSP